MAVRGSITDRPWGLTLGAIALRRHTGQLTIDSDGKRYCIAFDDGAIVGASSPMAADAIARVALTNHFITSTQVPDITRRLAASPDRDEVDVLADAIRFTPEQVLKLRNRLVAQRAARTFSLERGEFVIDEQISLRVFPGVAIDHRHVIYLGVRTNLSEQRLIDDLRQLGSQFTLKPEVIDDLPRFGFEPSAQPVLEALKAGTSLPELEAAYRELDPRFAQAIIYALVSCTACVIPPRTGSQPPVARTAPREAVATRRATRSLDSAAARTTTRPAKPTAMGTRTETLEASIARKERSGSSTAGGAGGAALPAEHAAPDAQPERLPPQPPMPAAPSAASPPQSLAAGTDTFPSTPSSSDPPSRVAPGTVPPYTGAARTTSSPFAGRTRTASPSAYSGGAAPDAGTNTPAATRARTQTEPPGGPRTQSRTTAPTTAGAQSPPVPARTATAQPPAARATLPPVASTPLDLTAPPNARTDTEETIRFTETPTPLPASAKQSAVTFGDPQPPRVTASPPLSPPARPGSSPTISTRPVLPRAPTPSELEMLRGFADQRTPGFIDQRTPGFADQRTPSEPRMSAQRTPTDPGYSHTRTSTGNPLLSRVSTDNAAAADEAFKRGELAMKRDQPGEAILEFKAALDLNPHEVDYAAMLAWAKFCAAGDKPGIGVETRRALERAVFKSQRPERARFYLGRVERMLGRDREALRHFLEVLEMKPNHAEAASEIRAIEARLQAARKDGGGLFGRKR